MDRQDRKRERCWLTSESNHLPALVLHLSCCFLIISWFLHYFAEQQSSTAPGIFSIVGNHSEATGVCGMVIVKMPDFDTIASLTLK